MGYKFSPSAGSIAIIGRCKNGPPLLFLHIQSGGGTENYACEMAGGRWWGGMGKGVKEREAWRGFRAQPEYHVSTYFTLKYVYWIWKHTVYKKPKQ